jgi:hypothetical protein
MRGIEALFNKPRINKQNTMNFIKGFEVLTAVGYTAV